MNGKHTSFAEIDFWRFIVRHLPKKLIYFAAQHVLVYASTGKHSVPMEKVIEIKALDALSKFSTDFHIL